MIFYSESIVVLNTRYIILVAANITNKININNLILNVPRFKNATNVSQFKNATKIISANEITLIIIFNTVYKAFFPNCKENTSH